MNGVPEINCETEEGANEEDSEKSDEENLSSAHHDKLD
jgi:hypothetical protein